MMSNSLSSHQPFEIDNAKKENAEVLSASFVPTPEYWRLLKPKNHIIVGSRGSGKTAIAKMLSHEYLSSSKNCELIELVKSQSIIGTYVSTSVSWVGALSCKPWQNKQEEELYFVSRFNLSTTISFLRTVRSCTKSYTKHKDELANKEIAISRALSEYLFPNLPRLDTFESIESRLYAFEDEAEISSASRLTNSGNDAIPFSGTKFSGEPVQPLRNCIRILSNELSISDSAKWFLCIDEAEYLTVSQQQIINTLLRSQLSSPDIIFKITTLPFHHKTLKTNMNAPLDHGHDYEYVNIDIDPINSKKSLEIASEIFSRRMRTQLPNLSINDSKTLLFEYFGQSQLLNAKTGNWADDSEEMNMLRRYANDDTYQRALRIKSTNTPKFADQVSRKLHEAMLLKHAYANIQGQEKPGIYSGAQMIVRCADGNPRRLLQLLSYFFPTGTDANKVRKPRQMRIHKKAQERILVLYGRSFLDRIVAEPEVGPEMYKMVKSLGEFFRSKIHSEQLSTDQILCFSVDHTTDKYYEKIIELAISKGIIYPAQKSEDYHGSSSGKRIYRLSYVFSPHFRILPRLGKANSLNEILKSRRQNARNRSKSASQRQRSFL